MSRWARSSDEWPTPPALVDRLACRFGPFDLDPASTDGNAVCDHHYTKADNGLQQEWHGRVFLNPPYGHGLEKWINKAVREVRRNHADLVCMVLPVWSDRRWFARMIPKAHRVVFLEGRVSFGSGSRKPRFATCVVVIAPRTSRPILEVMSLTPTERGLVRGVA